MAAHAFGPARHHAEVRQRMRRRQPAIDQLRGKLQVVAQRGAAHRIGESPLLHEP
ncbi:hypothetical protein D3C72_1132810 [compost metagenome]